MEVEIEENGNGGNGEKSVQNKVVENINECNENLQEENGNGGNGEKVVEGGELNF